MDVIRSPNELGHRDFFHQRSVFVLIRAVSADGIGPIPEVMDTQSTRIHLGSDGIFEVCEVRDHFFP